MKTASKACVIGWPIKHSRSPLIHSFWLKQLGIDGTYSKLAVPPESLADFVGSLRDGAFAGCNVTVPHKEAIIPLLDSVTATARAIGAVNTVWHEGGRLIGGNTDAEGFLANLDEQVPGWDAEPLHAVVLGAGGAARAVAYGLQQHGAESIALINRSRPRADALAADLGTPLKVAIWNDLPDLLPSATLLVNATSLGMSGGDELAVDLTPLDPAAVVVDIVYVPLRTRLIDDAGRRGHRTAEGLGMLLHQAAPGFVKWFGSRPMVTPDLRALVEADIVAPKPE